MWHLPIGVQKECQHSYLHHKNFDLLSYFSGLFGFTIEWTVEAAIEGDYRGEMVTRKERRHSGCMTRVICLSAVHKAIAATSHSFLRNKTAETTMLKILKGSQSQYPVYIQG